MSSLGENAPAFFTAPNNPMGAAMRLCLASIFAGPTALMLLGMSQIARQQHARHHNPT